MDIAPPAPPPAQYMNVREACINYAATIYHASVLDIKSIILTEGGTTGQVRRNKNGTVDMGVMQINSINIEPGGKLYGYGYTREMITNNECLNIILGTFLLQREIVLQPADRDGRWTAIGNYHSRTPEHNRTYQLQVWKNMQSLISEQPR